MLKKVMKINLKIIGIVVVVLIAVQVVTAYFFGIIAEKEFDNQFRKVTDSSLIKVVSRNYSRGWFTSDADVTLAVNNQALKNLASLLPTTGNESGVKLSDAEYKFNYKAHVTQGLFAGWLHGNFIPMMAYSTMDLNWPESLSKVLKTFFKDEAPLTIHNVLYLNKSGKFTINSPAFDYNEALSGVNIVWGGIKGSVAYDSSFNKFTNQLSVPNFDFSAPTKGSVVLKNLTYYSQTERSVNDIKVGIVDIKLESVNVNLSESAFNSSLKLGEIIQTATGVSSAEFLNGLDVINPTNFSLSNIRYSSQSSDENNFFSANVKAGFESLVSNHRTYGPMDFDFSLNHVVADRFSKIIDLINAQATESDDQRNMDKDKTIQSLKDNFVPIFVNNPVVQLNNLSVKTPDGLISIKGKATMNGFESSDINDKTKFLQKISANVDFSVPKPVMSYLFLLQMKYFLTAGNAQMDQQSSDALAKVVNILMDNQLQVWKSKGYIKESQGDLSSSIRFESGVVSLNGVATTSESSE